MKERSKKELLTGIGLLIAFMIWTALIMSVDVRPAGPNGSKVGFAAFNTRFHSLTGVSMTLYEITDWLGFVPVIICVCFGFFGLVQLIKRRSLLRVDADIILLGVYYLVVIAAYLFFEAVPINYRPILINGYLEASYPSSTTLLVLSVMPTLKFQIDRRIGNAVVRNAAGMSAALFSVFMVIGRLLSGVHWVTDIVGSILLSAGLFLLYRYVVTLADERREGTDGIQ